MKAPSHASSSRIPLALAFLVASAACASAAERKFTLSVPYENLDEFRAVAELAKELGADHVAANAVEPAMWQWDRNRYDPYPNWGFGNPTIFKFVVPDELKAWIPADYARRNLEALRARGKILREFGLKASFSGMEPAWFPEEAYRAHPAWRGPRCDQARRARGEYYAPCFDNAEVRAMYRKAVKELCEACPFDAFVFLSNDSGGGLCWCEGLYPGENGPYACRSVPMGVRISRYLSVFQDGARDAGLGDVDAGVRHIAPKDEIQSLPSLKKGQSINGRSMSGRSVSAGVSIGEYDEPTFPIWGLPRMGVYAKGLQCLRAAGKDTHLSIGFRSLEDRDAIDFVKAYFGKIGPGEAARYRAIEDFAATRVGKADAVALAGVWNAIDKVADLLLHYQTGGHIFMLGTVHQRWLTRPFVAFPEELKPEEKDYYRQFQFQAQSEKHADDMSDLQGNTWLKGYAASFLLSRSCEEADRLLGAAEDTAATLAARHAAEPYGKELKLLKLRLAAYRCVLMNAKHAITFQDIMDRADRVNPPRDKTPRIWDQGDSELVTINQIVRDEIDMSYRLADLIDQAPGRIFYTAPTKELTSVMHFEPDLSASLRKRAVIMENHRRDFLRLYMSKNR